MSWLKNKINRAYQVSTNNDVLDKFHFVDEIGTQCLSQLGEEVRTHRIQDAGAVIHGSAVIVQVSGATDMQPHLSNAICCVPHWVVLQPHGRSGDCESFCHLSVDSNVCKGGEIKIGRIN